MLKHILVIVGLVCGIQLRAAPVLTVDNPTQHVLPGGFADFNGSVEFDEFLPFGAAPVLSPDLPTGFLFHLPLGLAGSFNVGEIYSGPLFAITVPEDASPQIYLGLLTVAGSNPVAVTVIVDAVPEPGTFWLTIGGTVTAVILRKAHPHLGGRYRHASSLPVL